MARGGGGGGLDDIRGLRNEIHNKSGELDTKSTTPMSSQDDPQSRDGSFVGVLQCGAVWCSVVQCLTNCESATHMGSQDDCQSRDGSCIDVMHCVAVRCSVLQCVAVCLTNLRAVSCWVLRECVAVCCSVYHEPITSPVMGPSLLCCSVLQGVAG